MRDVDAVILMLFAVSQYTDCSVHCSFQSEGVDLAGVAVENPVVISLVHSHWSRMSRIVSHWSTASIVMFAPAVLCHKEPARRLLGALERKIPPLGGILLAPRWFFMA